MKPVRSRIKHTQRFQSVEERYYRGVVVKLPGFIIEHDPEWLEDYMGSRGHDEHLRYPIPNAVNFNPIKNLIYEICWR